MSPSDYVISSLDRKIQNKALKSDDPAFQLLLESFNTDDRRVLWFVDETISLHSINAVHPYPHLFVLTNRIDHYQCLKSKGFSVTLSDFDGSMYDDNSMDKIVYRLSKEKAIVHHIINQSQRLLKKQGCLVLSGFKSEGLKTYTGKAVKLLGHLEKKHKGRRNAKRVVIVKSQFDGIRLDDQQYSTLRSIDLGDGIDWQSKPGIFGWNKLDKGSALLWGQCAKLQEVTDSWPKTVLDLGCGYGYLGVMAGRFFGAVITGVDNNIAAVNACRENFRRHGICGQVLCDNCGDSLTTTFDLILCNPPFHRGFDIESSLARHFLEATHRLLAKKGRALFVVNAFIPLEQKAEDLFALVNVLANNGRFKVVELGMLAE